MRCGHAAALWVCKRGQAESEAQVTGKTSDRVVTAIQRILWCNGVDVAVGMCALSVDGLLIWMGCVALILRATVCVLMSTAVASNRPPEICDLSIFDMF